ncbi:DUF3160 domain-containing protein [Candidatus Gracilibacteria bacterium]|nr:DUF3160 domain-containing protein [Candidatus Gracilibacteria bacterium]MCF7856731.1 DUF3160 domain-containing protein [Candidatus Gracilibacteria bacterium]MCF7896939.1 DUF3160 domain-containing protein [Candidatus Gracilibacteria bacterium]
MSTPKKLLAVILAFVSLVGCSPNLPTEPPIVDENSTEIPSIEAENFDAVLNFLGIKLSQNQQNWLAENYFLLVPLESTKLVDRIPGNSFDEMLAAFDAIGGNYSTRAPENSKLVTPDVVLHGFHKFFENTLEYLEQNELTDTLKNFTADTRAKLLALKNSADSAIAARYEVLAAQFTVAQILFENANWDGVAVEPNFAENLDFTEVFKIQSEAEKAADATDTFANAEKLLANYSADFLPAILEKIRAELRLIYAADTLEVSPLFGEYKPENFADFTQFTPRSHYSKNSKLRAYFRTMMFFGRNSYFFKNDVGLSDAILLDAIFADDSIRADWQKIMKITGFFAGESDDVTLAVWDEFLGETKIVDVFNSENLAQIRTRLSELASPKILSDVIVDPAVFEQTKDDLLNESKSVRTFGQRFTFDAWILNRLTAGQEITETKLPSTPSALFVPAAFGDTTAREFADEFLQKTFAFTDDEIAGFNQKLDEVATDISNVTAAEWRGSLGTAWTKLLGTLIQKFDANYPLFMQSEFFPIKQIQTFLGSYTELKHDTLLYAKQSYAELGGGPGEEPPPVPRGFVEPNLDFWREMKSLVEFTQNIFTENNLLAREMEEWGALSRFQKQVDFCLAIAEKEMAGELITDDEFEKLRAFSLDYLAEPLENGKVFTDKDRRSELIADIHTDALLGQILYEATGRPFVQLALVDSDSAPRLTIGLVFNHFEFTAPIASRLTDEIWQSKVYENSAELPAKNFWYENLLVE